MRKTFAVLTLVASAACNPPTAPSPQERHINLLDPWELSLHHNIPATLADGTVMWVCATQYRTYLRPEDRTKPSYVNNTLVQTMVRTSEVDHYIQSAPCPVTPID